MGWFNLISKTKKKKKKTAQTDTAAEKRLLWQGMNFAATEAYNLLRTNLTLSFADEEGARMVGVTSTEHAEGKSMTGVNLAAALAKGNYKTLLLECDLRLPVLSKMLDTKAKTGVSEYLAGIVSNPEDMIYPVEQCENLSVIFCGRTPPNPSELLGSKRMESLLQELGRSFEYIIVDLPPVGVVSDALVMAAKLSGMIVVVRDDVTQQPELADTIRQLQYTGTRILGFVYNAAGASAHGYGYGRKYYKSYYKKYAKYGKYGYGYGYASATAKNTEQKENAQNG